jgi:prolyl-tRNA synthetase
MAAQISDAFKALSIAYENVDHEEAFTVEEQAKVVGHLPGMLTKNLVLKDKKEGIFLICAASHQTVEVKTLAKKMQLVSNKVNLRFATEDVLHSILKVKQGSVSPLAVMNDTENQVKLVLDQALLSAEKINCHPLQNDKTVSLTPSDLLKFVRHYNHEPLIVDFSVSVTEATSPRAKSAVTTKAAKNTTTVTKPEKMEKDSKSKEGMVWAKKENFADWYTDVITKSQMIDYYDISGCYVLRPWSYEIWERIQEYLDTKFKSIGVKNCYFPMFVTSEKLNREKDHVEGFAPEVAWVTKSGESDLKEPIAIRPTSETIMYPAFKSWIRSHRDLPLRLNQWCNVVRWEFKNPTPFIRTREFLWQEGHTAHATQESAATEVMQILQFYAGAYEEMLAVPMIQGKKSKKEQFAGADYTTTIEGFIPSTGRGIQAATSHHLGQNFGKMFGISAEDDHGNKIIPYQNSWGFTTRSIGVMVMIHGDDKGLVLPPRVAPLQVILIPIPVKDKDESDKMFDQGEALVVALRGRGVRAEVDHRRVYTPGWKYNHWELKGVPLRLELGPKDMQQHQVRVVRRDNNEKVDIPFSDLNTRIPLLLEQIQKDMLARARKERDNCIRVVSQWSDFVKHIADGCMVLTPFCNEVEWEEQVKTRSREESLAMMGEEGEAENTATSVAAKSLCMPFENNAMPMADGTKCFISGKPAKCWILWGRSY